jgi:hypothetical protein
VITVKKCIHMYANAKMILLKLLQESRGGDKGE